MNYKVRRNPDGLKEVAWNKTEHPDLTLEEFNSIAVKEFFGVPVYLAVFKIVPDKENPDLMVMGLNLEGLEVYPANPPPNAPRILANC